MTVVARLASLPRAGHPAVDVNGLNNHPHVPAPPPLNIVRQVLQEIQERLDVLEIKEREIVRERLELKSRWNRSVAVNQLPNEILFPIFVYFSEQPQKSNGDEDYEDYPRLRLANTGWTKLMLVCRRWRDVALATPALWRTIDVGKTSNWMKLALTHSGGATIDVSFPYDFEEEHASLLQPHCHRLRALRLRSWSPYALRVIRNTLPVLETLEIYSNPGGARALEARTDLGITRERFPNLRSLLLAYTVVPRDPVFYAPLRKLSLAGCPFDSSLEQFVQLLSDCPSLEHLELNSFLQQLSGGKNVGPPRSLPSLISVGLYNHSPIHSTRFLSRIVIPSATLSVVATYDEEQPGGTVRASVPPNLTSSLPRLATATWARLTIVYEEWIIECHPTKPGRGETPLVGLGLASCLAFDWERRMSDGLADLLSVFGSAPLTHLEVVGQCSTVPTETWATLFRTFPCLASLAAGAEGTLFAGLHQASLVGLANADTAPIACRGLERISLFGYSALLRKPDPVLGPLIHCLRYRADRGTPLKELDMDLHMEMDAVKGYLPQIKDIVSKVVLKCVS